MPSPRPADQHMISAINNKHNHNEELNNEQIKRWGRETCLVNKASKGKKYNLENLRS